MIYLLEDDTSIQNFVLYTLKNTGFEAEGFERPSDFWKRMEEEIPDLLLLDIMLPEEDGMEILKKLRDNRKTKNLPIIMLTAKGTEYDKVLGLDSGADDYVAKPFSMMELMSRIKALLRRSEIKEEKKDTYQVEPLYVNISKHIVKVNDEEVNSLTYKEFELLSMLLQHQETVLSRDQILQSIWGYDFDGESRTVDVHVRTLRQKLGDAGKLIETVRGFGYKIGKAEED
ncbi:ompR family two-component response regulator [Clostridium sp. CAG:590]|nr:response regulator transcription factor [Clostridium sp.]CCX85542.1 ompR family two-component response regulator [Clostridium sp. CAG:590]